MRADARWRLRAVLARNLLVAGGQIVMATWLRRSIAVACVCVAGSWFDQSAARADVLVLRDGTRVETRGPWLERGEQVLFTDLEGRLLALRTRDLDLEVSRAATVAAAQPKAKLPEVVPPAASRAAVLTLTDDDVGHVAPDQDGSPSASGGASAPSVVLYATSWCGYCRQMRQLLARLGVDYVEYDVDRNPVAAREWKRLAPGAGVPVTVVDGEVIRGYSERRITEVIERTRRKVAERPPSRPSPSAKD